MTLNRSNEKYRNASFVGECIQRVEENVPVATEFVNSIYRNYASEQGSCRLSVQGKTLCIADIYLRQGLRKIIQKVVYGFWWNISKVSGFGYHRRRSWLYFGRDPFFVDFRSFAILCHQQIKRKLRLRCVRRLAPFSAEVESFGRFQVRSMRVTH